MIKFEGTLSQDAKEWILKRSRISYLILCCFGLLACCLSATVTFSIKNGYIPPIDFYLDIIIVFIPFLILFRILFFHKKNKILFPKSVYIENGEIVSIAGFDKTKRKLNRVKEIWDYGEFYELEFPSLIKAANFICQKDLLVEGTIEEFEALFDGKIERCENGI